ncbi:hypothetical protein A7X99_00570 [Stenotrophomonas maltophilia]|nr:hypothetical protein A7X90_07210 [Stenotrophomonas maltophilia]PZT44385.1 hypothetical protein A7X99_00570 [Stenotrophomonas maltophilia]
MGISGHCLTHLRTFLSSLLIWAVVFIALLAFCMDLDERFGCFDESSAWIINGSVMFLMLG